MFRLSVKALSAPRSKTALLISAAALLAGAAVIVRRKSAQAEAQHPPGGEFLHIDGVKLHYIDQGSGDPIVLLHGNGSLLQDFYLAGVAQVLAKTNRVVAFDRPGFGYTNRPSGRIWNPDAQADLIHIAMRRLGLGPAVVVAHSLGTMVATALALTHADSVSRLVLVSGYYYPTPRLDVALAAVPAIPGIGTLMRNTLSPLIGRMMWPLVSKQLFSPAKVSMSFNGWPVWMTLRPSQLRASAADMAMMVPQAMHMSDRYGELRMPVTVLAGDGDKIVDSDVQSVRLHEALPDSALQVVPEAGHMLHHIVPDQVIAAILGHHQPTDKAVRQRIVAQSVANTIF